MYSSQNNLNGLRRLYDLVESEGRNLRAVQNCTVGSLCLSYFTSFHQSFSCESDSWSGLVEVGRNDEGDWGDSKPVREWCPHFYLLWNGPSTKEFATVVALLIGQGNTKTAPIVGKLTHSIFVESIRNFKRGKRCWLWLDATRNVYGQALC